MSLLFYINETESISDFTLSLCAPVIDPRDKVFYFEEQALAFVITTKVHLNSLIDSNSYISFILNKEDLSKVHFSKLKVTENCCKKVKLEDLKVDSIKDYSKVLPGRKVETTYRIEGIAKTIRFQYNGQPIVSLYDPVGYCYVPYED